jgi:hypothetical protein
VLSPLGVREIGAIVLVDRQAKPAFEGADVVFEEVRIFVQIDGLERELAQTFSSVGVGRRGGSYASAAEFRTRAVLVIHSGGWIEQVEENCGFEVCAALQRCGRSC